MDYSDIQKVTHETDPDRVQRYLDTKRWTILAVAPGQYEEGGAYCLYALGWRGPLNPSYPEDDQSEFPIVEDEENFGWQGI